MTNFFSEMLKCKKKIYDKRDRVLADKFIILQEFVESGVYSSCKKADEIAKLTLKGYNAHVLAEHFNLAYDTIRTEKRLISNELWKIFPKNFFEKFLEYRENKQYIDDCFYSMGVHDLTSDDFLLLDVKRSINHINNNTFEVFDIKDLTYEIEFLQRYSKTFFNSDLSNVDKEKLMYIIDILDGKKVNASLRTDIIKELQGGSSKC